MRLSAIIFIIFSLKSYADNTITCITASNGTTACSPVADTNTCNGSPCSLPGAATTTVAAVPNPSNNGSDTTIISVTPNSIEETVTLKTGNDSSFGRYILELNSANLVNVNVDLTPKPSNPTQTPAQPASNLVMTAPEVDTLNLNVSGYAGNNGENLSAKCATDVQNGVFSTSLSINSQILQNFINRRTQASPQFDINAPPNACDQVDLQQIQSLLPSSLFCPSSTTYSSNYDNNPSPSIPLQKWKSANKCSYQQDVHTCQNQGIRYKCQFNVSFKTTNTRCNSNFLGGSSVVCTWGGRNQAANQINLTAGIPRPFSASTPQESPYTIVSDFYEIQSYQCDCNLSISSFFGATGKCQDSINHQDIHFILDDSSFYAPVGADPSVLASTFCSGLETPENIVAAWPFNASVYYSVGDISGTLPNGDSYSPLSQAAKCTPADKPETVYTSWSVVPSPPTPTDILPGNTLNTGNISPSGSLFNEDYNFTSVDESCNSTASSTMDPPLNYTNDYFTQSPPFPTYLGLNSISTTTEISVVSSLLSYYSQNSCATGTSLTGNDQLSYGTHCAEDPVVNPIIEDNQGLVYSTGSGWSSTCPNLIQNDPSWVQTYTCSNGNCPNTISEWNKLNLVSSQSVSLPQGITGAEKGKATVLAYGINSINAIANPGSDGVSGSIDVLQTPTIKYCINQQDLSTLFADVANGAPTSILSSPTSITPSLTVYQVPTQAYNVTLPQTISNTLYDTKTMPSIYKRIDSSVRDWVNNNFPTN